MKCWASQLGGCGRGMSREHIVSECIFDAKDIQVHGWPGIGEYERSPVSSLVARVLCKSHNEALSSLDAEAKRLKTAMRDGYANSHLAHSSTESPVFTINGSLFSRWLAKTYCGRQAQFKYDPEPEFVNHAFGRAPGRALHFYVATQNGYSPYEYGRYWLKPGADGSSDALFCVYFSGLIWYMTNFPMTADRLEGDVCWIENPCEIEMKQPSPEGDFVASRIEVSWPSDQPKHVVIGGSPQGNVT